MPERFEPALLSSQPEWADVQPAAVPDASHAAVDIEVNAEYRDTFGLLYACIQSGELSERVLALTERCIALCSAHYSAWDVRYQVRSLSPRPAVTPSAANAPWIETHSVAAHACRWRPRHRRAARSARHDGSLPERLAATAHGAIERALRSVWRHWMPTWTQSGTCVIRSPSATAKTTSSGTTGGAARCAWVPGTRAVSSSLQPGHWSRTPRTTTSGVIARCDGGDAAAAPDSASAATRSTRARALSS